MPKFDDDPVFFKDDRLLSDVPFVPTAVFSVTFLSFDTDFVSDFYTDGLLVKDVVVFFTSLVFD
jgi:hypothetical protein